MIRAIPNNGNPSIVIDSDVQSDIEDVMLALGYGCTDYTLEMAESADGDVLDMQELRDRISATGSKVHQLRIKGRLHPDIGLDGHTSMVSRKVFTSREAAEAHLREFIEACTTPRDERDMNYIDPVGAHSGVVELELRDDFGKKTESSKT